MIKVTIFHNVQRVCRQCDQPVMPVGDGQYAHRKPGAGHIPSSVASAGYDGYQPGHTLVRVFETEVPEGTDPLSAADRMFEAFNAPAEMLSAELAGLEKAYRARQLRSLSVGDVVAVGEIPLACASRGWVPVTGEVNEVVAGDHGSVPWARAEVAG